MAGDMYSIIALYSNSPYNSIYLAVSRQPRLRPKLAHSILLSLLLMQPLNPAPALFGAKLMELWPVTCSIIALYYNSPNNRRYLAISQEPRLRPHLAHSILLSPLLMEPLSPAPALFGAKLMELWLVRCCVIALHYNLPKNSIYLAVSRQPRLRPQLAHSILLSLLLMHPAQLFMGLNSWSYGRLHLALSLFTTTRPTTVDISPFLGNQD
jgi:hypothetical protein